MFSRLAHLVIYAEYPTKKFGCVRYVRLAKRVLISRSHLKLMQVIQKIGIT